MTAEQNKEPEQLGVIEQIKKALAGFESRLAKLEELHPKVGVLERKVQAIESRGDNSGVLVAQLAKELKQAGEELGAIRGPILRDLNSRSIVPPVVEFKGDLLPLRAPKARRKGKK